MKRVIALELVGLAKLDCDLFDENGKTVYLKKTELTPEILMMLSHSQVYRLDNAKLREDIPKAPEQKKTEEKPAQEKAKQAETKTESTAEERLSEYNKLKDEYDKEVAALNRKFFNELNGKKLNDKERAHFNDLYKESVKGLKRKFFNDLYVEEQKERRHPGEIINDKIDNKPFHGEAKAGSFESLREQAFEEVKKVEPFNSPDLAEYHSVIELEKQDALIKEAKQVLYCAINSAQTDIKGCVRATEIILNEVYNKIRKVQNFNEFRIYNYYTFSHDLNVALISALIGREIGYPEYKVKDLTFSAFLHDVGKMKIPKEVLYKNGKLTDKEMELIKQHPQLGYDFLVNVLKLPIELAKAALEHHERWEGQGYPQGLKGNQISEFAQIVAIADVYDALVSNKVYKGSTQIAVALNIMLNEESHSFNPQILERFVYMGMRS